MRITSTAAWNSFMPGWSSAAINVICWFLNLQRSSREHAHSLNAAPFNNASQIKRRTRKFASFFVSHIIQGTQPQKIYSANGANNYYISRGRILFERKKTSTKFPLVSTRCVWHTAASKILTMYSRTVRSIVSMGPLSPPIWSRDWGTVIFYNYSDIYIYRERER